MDKAPGGCGGVDAFSSIPVSYKGTKVSSDPNPNSRHPDEAPPRINVIHLLKAQHGHPGVNNLVGPPSAGKLTLWVELVRDTSAQSVEKLGIKVASISSTSLLYSHLWISVRSLMLVLNLNIYPMLQQPEMFRDHAFLGGSVLATGKVSLWCLFSSLRPERHFKQAHATPREAPTA